MDISITANNTTLTEAIKQTVEDKLSALEVFLRPEDKIHVEIEEDTHHNSGDYSRVEIHITPHGYYADSRGGDFYEAIDLAIPKIKSQLAKNKDKRLSLRRRFGNLFKRSK